MNDRESLAVEPNLQESVSMQMQTNHGDIGLFGRLPDTLRSRIWNLVFSTQVKVEHILYKNDKLHTNSRQEPAVNQMRTALDIACPSLANELCVAYHRVPTFLLEVLYPGQNHMKPTLKSCMNLSEYRFDLIHHFELRLIGSGMGPKHRIDSITIKMKKVHQGWDVGLAVEEGKARPSKHRRAEREILDAIQEIMRRPNCDLPPTLDQAIVKRIIKEWKTQEDERVDEYGDQPSWILNQM